MTVPARWKECGHHPLLIQIQGICTVGPLLMVFAEWRKEQRHHPSTEVIPVDLSSGTFIEGGSGAAEGHSPTIRIAIW